MQYFYVLFFSVLAALPHHLISQMDSLNWVSRQNTLLLKTTYEHSAPEDYFRVLDSLKSISPAYPIVWGQDTLFILRVSFHHLSIQERQQKILSNLHFLSQLSDYSEKNYRILKEDGWNLFYGQKLLLTLDKWDVLWENQSPDSLVSQWKKRIHQSIMKYQRSTENTSTLFRVLKLSLIILIIGGLWWVVHYFSRYLQKLFLRRKLSFFKHIKVSNTALMSRVSFQLLRYLAIMFQYLLGVAILFFGIPLVASFFPDTEPFAKRIIDLVEKPVLLVVKGFVDYLPNLFTIIVVIVATRIFLRLVRFIAEAIEDEDIIIKGFYPEWAMPSYNLFKILTYLFMLIAIFPYLPGSDSPFFHGISVFVGLLISFGSGSAVSNLIAGIILTYMRPFKVGDLIQIDTLSGTVQEKGLWSIKIKTIKNEIVRISNVNALNQNITNYSESKNYIVRSTVSIGYETPWEKVHELLIQAAKMTPSVVENPPPFVLQLSLSDFFIVYEINAYTNNSLPYFEVTSLLNENIQKTFQQGNVQILSPHHLTLHSAPLKS